MVSDIQEEYNRRSFLKTLKEGRATIRKGLGKRLYLLCGFDPYNIPISDTTDHVGIYPFFEEDHKKIIYKREYLVNPHRVVDLMTTDVALQIYKKYLNEYTIRTLTLSFCVYYKKSHIISWAEMDNALKEMYPRNHRIDANGFVHFKRNPMIFIP